MTDESLRPKKKRVTPSRVVISLTLLLALVALAFDFRARRQWSDACEYARVHVNLGDATLREVQGEFGRAPIRSDKQPMRLGEEYVWDGVFYVYRVSVQYNGVGDEAILEQVTPDSYMRFSTPPDTP